MENNDNIVTLDEPIKRGDNTIGMVELRRPKAQALSGTNLADILQMNVDAIARVVPRISNPQLTEPEVRSLDPADLMKVGMKVAAFLLPKGNVELPSQIQ